MGRDLIVVNSYKGLLLVQAEAALIEVEHPHKGRGEGNPLALSSGLPHLDGITGVYCILGTARGL